MKKKKVIITVAIVAIAAIIAIIAWPKKSVPVEFEMTDVQPDTIRNSVTATGTIEPVTEVEVGTQVSGIISNIYVDYNSLVKKGQVIAELDKTTLNSELNSARANLASAKSELDYQTANYKRYITLNEKGLVSRNDYEVAYLDYRKALETYNTTKESVKKAETNIGYATITSPIDGIELSKEVEEGQTVAAGFETPTLFTIANDLTEMQVIADVDEADIGDIREGQRVTFTVDAYPNDVFEGVVTQIRLGDATSSSSSSTSSSSTVVTYEVVISAHNPDLKLKPRLTANVTIYTLDRKDVLCVPARALRFNPEKPLIGENDLVKDCEGEHKLWTREGNTFTAHPVETGISNGVSTEITSGISEGTVVVTEATLGNMPGENDSPAMTQEAGGEKSPFMPGPPGNNKKKSK